MTNRERLLKVKGLIENKLKLNNNLIETIKALQQDETTLLEENEAYNVALELINNELKEEDNTKIRKIQQDSQENNERIQDITRKIS